jgi:hypothetical protein
MIIGVAGIFVLGSRTLNMMQGHGRSEADMANVEVKLLATQWRELAQAIFSPLLRSNTSDWGLS